MGTDAVRLHVQNNENIFYSLMLMQMYKKMINGLFYFSSPLMTNDADASYIARPLFTLIMFCRPFVHNKYHGFSLFLGKFEQNHDTYYGSEKVCTNSELNLCQNGINMATTTSIYYGVHHW
jgi:hypothetical protein